MKSVNKALVPLLCLIMGLVTLRPCTAEMPPPGQSDFFYEIGGGIDIPLTVGSGSFVPYSLNVNAAVFDACGRFDPRYSVGQMIGDFQNKFAQIGSMFTAAVAGLPGYFICRANPLFCQLSENITARVEDMYNAGMDTCQEFQAAMVGDSDEMKGWIKALQADTWQREAASGGDPEEISREVSSTDGDEGVIWIGGQRAGGDNQPPIRVVADAVKAGYNMQFGRNTQNGMAVTLADPAADPIARFWRTPEEAAKWVVEVVGENRPDINNNPNGSSPPGPIAANTQEADGDSGNGGEDVTVNNAWLTNDISSPGMGLMAKVGKEESPIRDLIADYLTSGTLPSVDELQAVSGTSSSAVLTPELLRALRASPMRSVLGAQLARDIAIANVAQMAMAGRRALVAGLSEPNIAQFEPARKQLQYRLELLDREVDTLLKEKEVTKLLVSDTAVSLLKNYQSRRETLPEGATGSTPYIQGGAVSD
ncbi:MAG: hypothetical protein KZQ92_03055 [Candidatus Thiodiazotropha sp. (ex Lucinoma borealis)]|nr:hypothetical protein [Candidatus Thiodiazotropha sp. (ex Lucinoma borealis)]